MTVGEQDRTRRKEVQTTRDTFIVTPRRAAYDGMLDDFNLSQCIELESNPNGS